MRKVLLFTMTLIFSPSLLASEMSDYFAGLKTLDARFKQKVFGNKQQPGEKESSGRLIVKSPDLFYLEYTKPYKLLYVADGKKIWNYDEDLEQVTVKEQGDLLVNSPAMLLGNPQDLEKSYHVHNRGEKKGLSWFELIPKRQDANFESVSLAFKNNQLKMMEMRDNFGQITQLEFSQVTKNPHVEASQFKYTPPKGVDVIGQ